MTHSQKGVLHLIAGTSRYLFERMDRWVEEGKKSLFHHITHKDGSRGKISYAFAQNLDVLECFHAQAHVSARILPGARILHGAADPRFSTLALSSCRSGIGYSRIGNDTACEADDVDLFNLSAFPCVKHRRV